MREAMVVLPLRIIGRLLPDGGQRRARRNAWAAMVHDRAVARARTDAEAAVDRAWTAEVTAPPAFTAQH